MILKERELGRASCLCVLLDQMVSASKEANKEKLKTLLTGSGRRHGEQAWALLLVHLTLTSGSIISELNGCEQSEFSKPVSL